MTHATELSGIASLVPRYKRDKIEKLLDSHASLPDTTWPGIKYDIMTPCDYFYLNGAVKARGGVLFVGLADIRRVYSGQNSHDAQTVVCMNARKFDDGVICDGSKAHFDEIREIVNEYRTEAKPDLYEASSHTTIVIRLRDDIALEQAAAEFGVTPEDNFVQWSRLDGRTLIAIRKERNDEE
jgi:hypothetical protein